MYMILRLALADPAPTLMAQLLIDARHVTVTSWSVTWLLVATSLIMGFLIAIIGFSTVLVDLVQRLPSEVLVPFGPENTSFTYNYPLLRKNKNEDYATWLISEYYVTSRLRRTYRSAQSSAWPSSTCTSFSSWSRTLPVRYRG